MIYFIHGYKEDPKPIAQRLGATPVYVDWSKPLSFSMFATKPGDILVGFSLGAVLAYMISKKYGSKTILCSMTPIKKYPYELFLSETAKDMSFDNAKKVVDELYSLEIDEQSNFSGEHETMIDSFIKIPGVAHEMTDQYIAVVKKALSS